MNANELADALKSMETGWFDDLTLKEAATMLRQQQQLIEILNGRIERMIENQSHHEGIAHAGGFEAGWQSAQTEIEALKKQIEIILEANTRSRP
jgi:tellurite resistance protein